jgi:hypothetical protein
MANTGEPDLAALRTDTVFDFEMTGLNPQPHAETVNREHAAFVYWRFTGDVFVR